MQQHTKRKRQLILLLCVCVCLLFGLRPTHKGAEQPLSVTISSLPVFYPLKTKNTPPKKAQLSVQCVFQYPELPNGCEITSLATALNYYGFAVDKMTLAEEYLPTAPLTQSRYGAHGPDPDVAYAGNPADTWYAYYCFAKPIVQAANDYLTDQGERAAALDISGANEAELVRYIANGTPVLVWATITMHEPYKSGFQWILPDETVYTPFNNLHCMVLTGYDQENFYFADPVYGRRIVERSLFMDRYKKIGSYAVVLKLPPVDGAPYFMRSPTES